ncbi:hypothetical protein MUK42_37337 [Musa troglodytarum]|uniref:Uncharacterized protein n=1 Tax=Musa troglodytarum TaxID=320322 RepID=A0A9E7FUG4_9LILI|nr:hypothetical protein MUK42_37337 [Musa troglodytarum]
MAAEEIAASGTHGKRRRRSCLLSCFRASLVSDTTEAKATESLGVPGKRPRWWKFGEKKKTVPVNVMGDATPTRGKEAPKPGNSGFLRRRFHKVGDSLQLTVAFDPSNDVYDTDNGTEGPITGTHQVHQPQHPSAGAQNPRARHVTSRCKTRTEPAPTYRVPDRTRIGTRTSHPGSPEPGLHAASTHVKPPMKGAGELDSAAGLLVLAVALALALLLFCGRTCTVLCLCTLFYFLPRMRATSAARGAGTGGEGGCEIDVGSEEYKKMVVLKGLLERDGRRPSLTKLAGAQ